MTLPKLSDKIRAWSERKDGGVSYNMLREASSGIRALEARIAELEAENAALRDDLSGWQKQCKTAWRDMYEINQAMLITRGNK